jgi:hypothetical protein
LDDVISLPYAIPETRAFAPPPPDLTTRMNTCKMGKTNSQDGGAKGEKKSVSTQINTYNLIEL